MSVKNFRAVRGEGTEETLEVRGLAAEGVYHTRGFTDIIQDVTVYFKAGELTALVGPSGAGKSTLMKCCAGIYGTSAGTVELCIDGDGREDDAVQASSPAALCGFVPQDDLVHPSLTVEQELTYAAALRLSLDEEAEEVRERVERTLELLKLEERRDVRIASLSGGQRKRVSIGVEVLTRPPVLFLDEPTAGLDPALEEKMTAFFISLAREGRIVVMTTHLFENLDGVDRICVMQDGLLIFEGTPRQALSFFSVGRLVELFDVLGKREARQWLRMWMAHPSWSSTMRTLSNEIKSGAHAIRIA